MARNVTHWSQGCNVYVTRRPPLSRTSRYSGLRFINAEWAAKHPKWVRCLRVWIILVYALSKPTEKLCILEQKYTATLMQNPWLCQFAQGDQQSHRVLVQRRGQWGVVTCTRQP